MRARISSDVVGIEQRRRRFSALLQTWYLASRARLREVADAVVAGVVQAPQLASLSVGGAASVSDAGCLRTFTVR